MKKFIVISIGMLFLLVACGTPLSVADEACKAYNSGDYDLAYSKFSKLIRDNSEDSDYKNARGDLSLVMEWERGEIDSNGCDTNYSDNVNFCSGDPTEAKYNLDKFCA